MAVPAQLFPAGPQYLDLPAVIEVSGIERNSYSGKFQYGDPNGLYVRTTVEAMRVLYHMKYPSGYDMIGGLTDDRVIHTCYVHVKNFNSQPSHYIAVGNHNSNFPGQFYWEMYATGEWRENMNRETVDDMRYGRGGRGFMQQNQGQAKTWNQIRSLLPQCQYYSSGNFAFRSCAITPGLLTQLVGTDFPRLMRYIKHLQTQLKGANKQIFQEAVWLHVQLCELTQDKRQAAQDAVVSERDALASANAGLLAQLAQLQAQLARQAGGADDEKTAEPEQVDELEALKRKRDYLLTEMAKIQDEQRPEWQHQRAELERQAASVEARIRSYYLRNRLGRDVDDEKMQEKPEKK